MLVNNDVRYCTCPLCRSTKIGFVGIVKYNNPTLFSTTEISLAKIPELWKCKTCDSCFTQNTISEIDAANLYTKGVGGDRWSVGIFKESKTKETLRALERIFIPGKKVLDIGCNTGDLLDYALMRGCITSGVEYSVSSIKLLTDKGHRVFNRLEDVSDGYDVISAFDLVEHLYDISKFMALCKQKLNRDGLIVISTGNISSISSRLTYSKWWYLRYPEHIIFPSKKYFESFSGYNVKNWVGTYASIGYKKALYEVILGTANAFIKGNCNGLPSLGPDHQLVVLSR